MDAQTEPTRPRTAERLRRVESSERARAFREVYDVILGDILEQHRRDGRTLHLGANDKIARFVRATAGRGAAVLEVGCGFGLTAAAVSLGQRETIGVDAAPVAVEAANERARGRDDLRFAVMDATRLEFPDATFDLVYTLDMVEHLHPDDLPSHLREAHRVLRRGGLYLVKTPSELTGPHEGMDPGRHGFLHFREYRYGTLLPLLRAAGFRRLASPAFSMRISCRLPGRSRTPAVVNLPAEAIASAFPHRSATRNFLARFFGVKQVIVTAVKP